MSVKQGMLALLSEQPMGVAGLRRAFEDRTGGTWPLNIGQVYTTIGRLERDGLIEPAEPAMDDDDGVELYALTESGREAAEGWWREPVRRGTPDRDELVIKVALAVTSAGVSVADVVQRQRTETMRVLRDLTKLSAGIDPSMAEDLSWSLVLDNHIFAAEAELRWLDHIETRAARASVEPAVSIAPEAPVASGKRATKKARR